MQTFARLQFFFLPQKKANVVTASVSGFKFMLGIFIFLHDILGMVEKQLIVWFFFFPNKTITI